MKPFQNAILLGITSFSLFAPSKASAQAPATVPNIFQAGEPASAAKVNENFQFQQTKILALEAAQETAQTTINTLLARVTALEQSATQLFKGNNTQNTYEFVSSQTVLEADIASQGTLALVNNYVAKGTILLNSNNTWSLTINQQEYELNCISNILDVVTSTPANESLSGTWTLNGNVLTLSNIEGVVVTFTKSLGGDMLISPNNEIRIDGQTRRATAGSVAAIKVGEAVIPPAP